MSRFVIDRFKGRVALGIVIIDLNDGKTTVTGYDTKSTREIEFLLSKQYSVPRYATSGASALSVDTMDLLKPGSEEHFVAFMHALPEYGFSARQID